MVCGNMLLLSQLTHKTLCCDVLPKSLDQDGNKSAAVIGAVVSVIACMLCVGVILRFRHHEERGRHARIARLGKSTNMVTNSTFEQFGQPQDLGFTSPSDLGLVRGVYKAMPAGGATRDDGGTGHGADTEDNRYATCTDDMTPPPAGSVASATGIPQCMPMQLNSPLQGNKGPTVYASTESCTDPTGTTDRVHPVADDGNVSRWNACEDNAFVCRHAKAMHSVHIHVKILHSG
eukprot:m.431588 g.431588  ORF g.431588 m.431588 type:complete len:233 (+) comp21406_c0_seq1:303-1001(+)